MTYVHIMENIKTSIPATLLEKYCDLSYGEMATIDELSEWAEQLQQAENDWWAVND